MTPEQKEYLEALMDRQGRLTPEEVVADAKRDDSPLHDLFQWNLRKAAAAHWLDRARELIRCIKVTVVTHEQSQVSVRVPAFVRDPAKPATETGYRSITHVRNDKAAARGVMLDELSRVTGALERAKLVAAALDASPAVEDLIERTQRFRRDIETRFPA